jgi:hypothetical protein
MSSTTGTVSLGTDRQIASAILARLDRLPATRHVWTMVALLSLGGMFEFYDLFMTGYVVPGLVKAGMLTGVAIGMFSGPALFVASTFFGLFIGTFVFGFVADKYGRRAIFTFSMLAYCAATLIMALQTTGFGVCLWRAIAGIGIGVELVTIDTYIAELVPKHMRGVGWLALGGGDRGHGRAVRVVHAARHPGKSALAADSWPAGRGRGGHREDRGRGDRRPRRRGLATTRHA